MFKLCALQHDIRKIVVLENFDIEVFNTLHIVLKMLFGGVVIFGDCRLNCALGKFAFEVI